MPYLPQGTSQAQPRTRRNDGELHGGQDLRMQRAHEWDKWQQQKCTTNEQCRPLFKDGACARGKGDGDFACAWQVTRTCRALPVATCIHRDGAVLPTAMQCT